MVSNQQVIHDFRLILKHLKKLPSFQKNDSHLRKIIMDKYKVGSKETKTQLIHNYRAAAHNYARMVTDISELKYLRGLDTGEKLDPRAKIQATARRVGLSVPHFSDEVNYSETLKRNETF